jgi:hypothetical protein
VQARRRQGRGEPHRVRMLAETAERGEIAISSGCAADTGTDADAIATAHRGIGGLVSVEPLHAQSQRDGGSGRPRAAAALLAFARRTETPPPSSPRVGLAFVAGARWPPPRRASARPAVPAREDGARGSAAPRSGSRWPRPRAMGSATTAPGLWAALAAPRRRPACQSGPARGSTPEDIRIAHARARRACDPDRAAADFLHRQPHLRIRISDDFRSSAFGSRDPGGANRWPAPRLGILRRRGWAKRPR